MKVTKINEYSKKEIGYISLFDYCLKKLGGKMETKKQDYKKLLGYIKHNDLEHKTFNKISFSIEEYEVLVSDDPFNKGFYYISIYVKKTKTTPPSVIIAAKKTMEEVLELIDANVFGVKTIAPTADANPNSTFN